MDISEIDPIVSVIMPCYNSEEYLPDAIKSVLGQTFDKFEFIIINDASTDNSLDVIKSFKQYDSRIKIINNSKNLGIARSRNEGLRVARGKYIAAHDSDDISFPKRLELQVNWLNGHPDCGVVGSHIEIFNHITNEPIATRFYSSKDEELRRKIFFYSPIAQPASMIRREVFDKIGFYDPSYTPADDLDLWFRIGNYYKFSNIQEVLLRYRFRPNSATTGNTSMMEIMTNRIRWKNLKNPAYSASVVELAFNILHLVSIYSIPPSIKIWLFSKLRDRRV